MGVGPVVASQELNRVVFEKIKAGDVVSIMVRGYRPEGEIYRVLFFVSNKATGITSGIYGCFEEELNKAPDRFVPLHDIIVLDFVAEKYSNAEHSIRSLVLEINRLRKNIDRHNENVKKNLMIAG